MDSLPSNELKHHSDADDLRSWINKVLAGLMIVVLGYLGRELGDLRATVADSKVVFSKVSEQIMELIRVKEDHEQRIRELEKYRERRER